MNERNARVTIPSPHEESSVVQPDRCKTARTKRTLRCEAVVTNTSGAFTFFSKAAYARALITDAERAAPGSRLLVATMNFFPDEPLVAELLAALALAAKRGVRVTLSFDAFNFLVLGKKQPVRPGPLWHHADFPTRLDHASRERLTAVRQLRAAGATVGITNQPRRAHTTPFAGRSHIKAAIVGDKLYIGGCNLSDMTQADAMACWHDPATADWLYGLLQTVAETERTADVFRGADRERAIDAKTSLFIDAGVRRQSLIFDTALALIDDAREWLILTCQYFPHGVTAQALARAARRGVQVRLIFNRSAQHGPLHRFPQQAVIWREHFRSLPRDFFAGSLPPGDPYIHAKLLATDRGALIGSHNYVTNGVDFGTAEIALRRLDAGFSHAAARCVLAQTSLAMNPRFSFLTTA